MKKHFFSQGRLVYMAGPEGMKGPESAEKSKETAQKAAMEDPAKRHEVYAKAQAKAKELLASEDPKKKEKGRQLMERVKQARDDEAKYDESMAITMAKGLERTLQVIARTEKPKAKPSAEKEKEVAKLAAELDRMDNEMTAKLEGKTETEEKVAAKPGKTEQEVAALSAELDKLDAEMTAKLKGTGAVMPETEGETTPEEKVAVKPEKKAPEKG